MPVPRNEHNTPEPDSRSGRGGDSCGIGQLILPGPENTAGPLRTARLPHGREADIDMWAAPQPPRRNARAPGSGAGVRRPWPVSRSIPRGPLGPYANNTAMASSPSAFASGIRILPKRQPGDRPASLRQIRASPPSDSVSRDGQRQKAIRIAAAPNEFDFGEWTQCSDRCTAFDRHDQQTVGWTIFIVPVR